MRFPLGEMTVGDILDRGIKLLFARLPLFYAINLLVQSPIIALQLAQPFILHNLQGGAKGGASDPAVAFAALGFMLALVGLTLLLQPLGTAAILHVIMQTYVGKPAGLGGAFSFALSRFLSLVAASLLVGLIVGLGILLCCIPGIFFWIVYAFMAQAVVLEKLGPLEGMQRSWNLTYGYRWRVLGVLLLIVVANLIVTMVIGVVLQLALPPADVVNHPENHIIHVVITYAVSILFASYLAVCTTLLYLDLRIRKEGYDLELAAQLGEEARGPRRRRRYDDEDDDDDDYDRDDDRRRHRRDRDEDDEYDRDRDRRDHDDRHRDEGHDDEEGLDPKRPFRR